MIWFDIEIPKSVLFYKVIIEKLKEKGHKVLITTRGGEGYNELIELMKLYYPDDQVYSIGIFGGGTLKGKLLASIERQMALLEFITNFEIDRLVTLCSVDATRVAFGLGIPVINFYDIPLSDYKANFKKALPQARLTLPISTKVFKPFVVPDDIFRRFSLVDNQIVSYNFIDPLIWLKDFKVDYQLANEMIGRLFKDVTKPLIVVREEEYKASYVEKKYPILYKALPKIHAEFGANILIIPRYESEYLEKEFPFATILHEKIEIQHILAIADLFIGGGGTINTEACFFGTPTISTRSFICHYDKFQIDSELMHWAESTSQLLELTKKVIGKRIGGQADLVFSKMEIDLDLIINNILA